MSDMNEVQLRAQEIYLSTAVLENNFTPNSESKIAKALILEGFNAGSSSVGRWKKKFGWEVLLTTKITAAMSEDKQTNDIIHNSGLAVMVKKTEVDVAQNNTLIVASYQVLEHVVEQILKNIEAGKPVTDDDFDKIYKVARLSTERHDKMLDRLANMPPRAISSEEVYERLKNTEVDYEEAEVLEDQNTVTLSHELEEDS